MAYVSGTAADINALRTNILTACTDNGWTLSGDVLWKGNCYIRCQVVSGYIQWLGGTGKDGSNALTGSAPRVVRNGSLQSDALTFPCSYQVFISTNPDEVVAVINYSTDFYQYVMFGLSDVPALPGVGVYVCATLNQAVTTGNFSVTAGGTDLGSYGDLQGTAPFQITVVGSSTNTQNSFIHHGLDGGGWSRDGAVGSGIPMTFGPNNPLLSILPSAWNDETVLLPFPVYVSRSTGNKISLVADLKHIRHCRIDYHDPGDVITLGTDKWKLFPWYKKNTTTRIGGFSVRHSGTVGFAVRYDGP